MRGNTKRKRDVTVPRGLDDFIALDCSTVLLIVFRDSLALISKIEKNAIHFERHSTFIFICFKSFLFLHGEQKQLVCVYAHEKCTRISDLQLQFDKKKKGNLMLLLILKNKKRSRDDSIHQRPLLLFIQIQLRYNIII